WKAKGIMAYMLSKPDDWTFYLDELQKHSTDGRTSFRAGFDELKKQGYVKKVRKRKKDGTFEWQTILYESPHVGFPHMDKPHTDNQTLLSINELSIDELNNDKQYRGLNSPSVQNEQSNTRDYTETTTDIKDYSSKIKDLLSHFSSINNFEELNEEYWDVVKKTRATEKIQPSVIYKTMIKCTKQDNRIVEHALKKHIKKCKGKDEKYTLGIMRNTTLDEVEKSKGYREAVDF